MLATQWASIPQGISPDGGAVATSPFLNRASAHAVLGLVLALRAAQGRFSDPSQRRQAQIVASQLLTEYLAYQAAVSISVEKSEWTANP